MSVTDGNKGTEDTKQTRDTKQTKGTEGTKNDTTDTVAELKALVAELSARIESLEGQAARWHPEVSDEVLLAVSAACAAYLGKRATIKQVHLRRGGAWASQGRAAAQEQHAELHGYGDRQTGPTLQARRGTK